MPIVTFIATQVAIAVAVKVAPAVLAVAKTTYDRLTTK
jgi:hypothetical protein